MSLRCYTRGLLVVSAMLVAAVAVGQEPGGEVAAELAAQAALEASPVYATLPATPPRQPEAIVFFSNFDTDNGGLTGSLDWEWGATYAWSGASCDSSNYPPPAAYSGTGMWGTVLNDCYNNLGNNAGYASCANSNPTDDSILTLVVDLTNYTDAALSFYEWYDLFSNWDWAEVYANGTPVIQHCESSHTIPTAWVQKTADLTPYVGGVVTIEFHMMASTVVNHAGWYIDDLMIDGTMIPVELQSLSVD